MKKKLTLATLGLLMFFALLGYLNRVPIATTYRSAMTGYHLREADRINLQLHKAMAVERQAIAAQQSTTELNGQVSELIEKRRYHCESLVELGHFFHEEYAFDRLPDGSGVYVDVQVRWMTAFPNSPYSSFGGGVLDVYDTTDSKPRWDKFVATHNISDYPQRYLTQNTDEAEPSDATQRRSRPF